MGNYQAKSLKAKYEVIEIGSEVCKIIKKVYFNDIHWSKCHNEVADKFTQMKKIYRKLFSNVKDLDMLEILKQYNQQDVEDLFSHAKDDEKKVTK